MQRNTSITLGHHFDDFVTNKIKDGRFNSVSEAIRAGLRLLEEKETEYEQKLAALRANLAEGEAQADRGEFVDYSLDKIKAELDSDLQNNKR